MVGNLDLYHALSHLINLYLVAIAPSTTAAVTTRMPQPRRAVPHLQGGVPIS